MHQKFFVSADAIIEKDGKILLTKRSIEPFKGKFCLPGGHSEGENIEDTIVREIKEETNLNIEPVEILGTYSDPQRDPRGYTITTVFICKITGGEVKAGDDASEAKFYDFEDLPELAFDHVRIIRDYLRWKEEGGTHWSSKWL